MGKQCVDWRDCLGRPRRLFLRIFGWSSQLNLVTMSEKEGQSQERGVGESDCGVILGYWDHEETPTLIQDLERSVDLVERKCKNLLEELMCYKKYLEESEGGEIHLAVLKKKNKKSKNCNFFSGSDPDIAFRKNLINLQETQQVFEEKFQEKLFNINKELRAAAEKLGLKDSIILFPTDGYLQSLRKQTESKARKSWSEVRDKFIKLNHSKAKTKSDPVIFDIAGNEQFAKITRNELELYQKLSRLSLKKTRARKAIASKGRKINFRCKKKTPRFRQDPQDQDSRQKRSKKRTRKAAAPPKPPRRSPKRSPSDGDRQETHPAEDATKKNSQEAKAPLGMWMRKSIPFTACTSTSRSYNIGLNMQQLLSLSKSGMKGVPRASLPKQSEAASTFRKGPNREEVEKRHSVSWIPGAESGGFGGEALGGKVWVAEGRASSNVRKARCKYTGSPPGRLMEYHKSTMRRYTDGQKSMIKSESESAYAVGSKIMVSGCERTDVFEIGQDEGLAGRASGDGALGPETGNPSVEWAKVYGSFLDTYRKYTALKEKLSDRTSLPSSDELKSLEREIDCAIGKYKDFLQFYGRFLHLKHRLKSLKTACETRTFGRLASSSTNCHGRVYALRPTCSMAMKRAFKEVRALQDKISLVSD